jgi:hypothetical protein
MKIDKNVRSNDLSSLEFYIDNFRREDLKFDIFQVDRLAAMSFRRRGVKVYLQITSSDSRYIPLDLMVRNHYPNAVLTSWSYGLGGTWRLNPDSVRSLC